MQVPPLVNGFSVPLFVMISGKVYNAVIILSTQLLREQFSTQLFTPSQAQSAKFTTQELQNYGLNLGQPHPMQLNRVTGNQS